MKNCIEEQISQVVNLLVEVIYEKVKSEVMAELKTTGDMPDKILTAKEVCGYYNVGPTTLERHVRAGLKYSQAVKKGNRLFKLSDCEKFFKIN